MVQEMPGVCLVPLQTTRERHNIVWKMLNIKFSRCKKERYKKGKLKDGTLRERRGEPQGWSARGVENNSRHRLHGANRRQCNIAFTIMIDDGGAVIKEEGS